MIPTKKLFGLEACLKAQLASVSSKRSGPIQEGRPCHRPRHGRGGRLRQRCRCGGGEGAVGSRVDPVRASYPLPLYCLPFRIASLPYCLLTVPWLPNSAAPPCGCPLPFAAAARASVSGHKSVVRFKTVFEAQKNKRSKNITCS